MDKLSVRQIVYDKILSVKCLALGSNVKRIQDFAFSRVLVTALTGMNPFNMAITTRNASRCANGEKYAAAAARTFVLTDIRS